MEEALKRRPKSAIPDTTAEIAIYAQPLVQEMKRLDALEAAEREAERHPGWRGVIRALLGRDSSRTSKSAASRRTRR
jgi:hypothetical protein